MPIAISPAKVDAQPGLDQPVRLRPHHLLCMLTYAGKGYSEAFTAGFDAIVARLSRGAPVQVVDGPDDICAPLRHDATAHCQSDSVRQRDQRAAADLHALLQRPVAAGTLLTLDGPSLVAWRQAFAQGRTRAACAGCEWQSLCSAIAADGFGAARLQVIRGSCQLQDPR
jgi:hypothetical protein